MTREKLESAKHLFLIFPAGCGGNHLANMLSMNPMFAQRSTMNPNRYINYMVQNYFTKFGLPDGGSSVAHFTDLENLDLELIETHQQEILDSEGIYIFCAHAFEFTLRKKYLVPFKNKIFFLFSVPTEGNKLVKSRMINGPWNNGESINQVFGRGSKIEELYNPEVFCKENSLSMDQIVLIDTDRFYSYEGYDYLNEVLYENFCTTLHLFCKDLHSIYIKYNESSNLVDK